MMLNVVKTSTFFILSKNKHSISETVNIGVDNATVDLYEYGTTLMVDAQGIFKQYIR